jgi:hypothetical protein
MSRCARCGSIPAVIEWLAWTGSAFAAVATAAAGTAVVVLYPPLPRDLGGAPDLDAMARRVRVPIPGDGFLDGWHLAGTVPAAVLIFHGYGRTHHRAWRYAAFLHAAGYHVFTVDFRSSRGRGRRPTTLGHYEREDALAALDWLVRELPGSAIGVLGESLGGSVAMWLAAERPEVAAVIADCPFANAAEALEDSCERWARLPRQPSAAWLRRIGRTVTGLDPGAGDTLEVMPRLAGRPLFFIHAAEDDRIAPGQTERLWRAAGGRDPLWVVAGAGHNEAWIRHQATYEERALRFFERHLLGRGPGLPAGRL